MIFILFFAHVTLVSKVNFMQNDDWNRTTSVKRFLYGDLSLLQVTATTFYTQGIFGFLFSLIFGWKRLPILTLVISVLNFYVFAKILLDHLHLEKLKSILVSLILFYTPLHIYSSLGFMTENYTMLFMLLSLYFLLKYEKSRSLKDFAFFNISGIFSFFTKQNGIIINFSYIPYLILKRRFKEAFLQSIIVGSLFLYYFFLFPQTEEMQSKGFIYENFSDIGYAYSLIYGILLVTVSFVIPFVFNFIFTTIIQNKNKAKKIIFILSVSIIIYFLLNRFFTPGKISWEEYPYFENTFERTGFFPRSILGTKYYFKWNYDIYRYWDIGSKILLAFCIPCLILARKKIINIYSVSIVGYLILMVFTKAFYDRYIFPLIPLTILFFLDISVYEKKWQHLYSSAVAVFLIFTFFLSYQMSNDFVLVNNYVWSRSETLVKEGVLPKEIRSTMAWQKLHGLNSEANFFFSYSSPETEPKYLDKYELFEEKEFSFKGSVFVEPRIYLYRKK